MQVYIFMIEIRFATLFYKISIVGRWFFSLVNISRFLTYFYCFCIRICVSIKFQLSHNVKMNISMMDMLFVMLIYTKSLEGRKEIVMELRRNFSC